MTPPRLPKASDVKNAAQAAVDAAQEAAGGAMRIPPASAQLIAQLPGLIENLAAATERLNATLDRAERYMALADPTLRAIDRLLPQLEAQLARGDDVLRTLRQVPGVSTFGRLTGLSPEAAAQEGQAADEKPKRRPRRGNR
ncbi:hypothetical protein LV457_09170 [Mycobacterium sp. MYCO198283]|uniref:hypothetical protein n=1 Tax=Mycobacterium sp. MYCO198283 TaxID=2883505 RepID=UPI001E54FD81|nr:hypothetical protein [Mycobacterium sp. MYCO198283]MCG5432462.1 hypothetical protein [Mycobacterium sp. MYCO198283]